MNCPSCGGRLATSSGVCLSCGDAGRRGLAFAKHEGGIVTGAGIGPVPAAPQAEVIPAAVYATQPGGDRTSLSLHGLRQGDVPTGFGAQVAGAHRPGSAAHAAAETGIGMDSDSTHPDGTLARPPISSDRPEEQSHLTGGPAPLEDGTRLPDPTDPSLEELTRLAPPAEASLEEQTRLAVPPAAACEDRTRLAVSPDAVGTDAPGPDETRLSSMPNLNPDETRLAPTSRSGGGGIA